MNTLAQTEVSGAWVFIHSFYSSDVFLAFFGRSLHYQSCTTFRGQDSWTISTESIIKAYRNYEVSILLLRVGN